MSDAAGQSMPQFRTYLVIYVALMALLAATVAAAFVPADRLLVYEAKQGWDPLCKFLDVPVPDAPFPRVNSREEMAATMAAHGPITSGGELVSMIKQHLGRA